MSLFNLELLHSICGNSVKGVTEILTSFNEELGIQLNKIREALETNEFSSLAKTMHNVKSMIGIVTDQGLASSVSEMAKASFYHQDPEVVKTGIIQFLQQAELLQNDAERIIFQLSGK
jgi:HPt (histidine-containing phosphotransfer) domain-containing protein